MAILRIGREQVERPRAHVPIDYSDHWRQANGAGARKKGAHRNGGTPPMTGAGYCTCAQLPSSIGRNAFSAGMVARTL